MSNSSLEVQLEPVKALTAKADLSIVNLEAPLTTHDEPISKTGPVLKNHPNTAVWMKNSGFDIVTLANNHILDFGEKGIRDTFQVLDQSDIAYVGAGATFSLAERPKYIQRNGLKLAVINIAENEWSTTHGNVHGANPVDPVSNYNVIKAAKSQADFVLVIHHGGHEMYSYPSPRLKRLLRFYVDTGASAVINHHPHCISGYEVYQDAPIFYSIGNFLFPSLSTNNSIWHEGMGVYLTFNKRGKVSFEFFLFNQFIDNLIFEVLVEDLSNARLKALSEQNEVIQNDRLLQVFFEQWVKKHTKQYSAYLEPHPNRYLQALQNRKWIPSLWSARKKKLLLNLIRCESHRDILIALLSKQKEKN